MNENFRQGVAALKAGDRARARSLLGAAVRESPEDTQAWLWLSGAVERDEERIYCLRQVLQLDPGNQVASKGLVQILDRWTRAHPEHAPVPPQENAADSPSRAAEPGSAQSGSLQEREIASASSAPVPEPARASAEAAASPPIQAQTAPEPPTPAISESERQPAPAPPPPPLSARPAFQHPAHPNLRFMMQSGGEMDGTPVFKTRPSTAHILMGFWVMFFGVWAMNGILKEGGQIELPLTMMNCSILGAVIAYLLVQLSLTRYELTTRHLILSARGKRTILPLRHILEISMQQNWLQRLLRTGDIIIEASVAGELKQIRLQHISGYAARMEQLRQMIASI